MSKEGFLTYIDSYIKKHDIERTDKEFYLSDIDPIFKKSAEDYISYKYRMATDFLRSKGYIKFDKNNNIYIELTNKQNMGLIIKKENTKIDLKNEDINNGKCNYIYTSENNFLTFVKGMSFVNYKKLKKEFSMFLKDFKDVENTDNIILDSFKELCSEIRKKDKIEKQKEREQQHQKLINEVEEIYFDDSETAEKMPRLRNGYEGGITSHNEIDVFKRHNLMMNLLPEKSVIAKGTSKDSKYLICLYNIDKLQNDDKLYALVMEPYSSYGYTKTAYFQSQNDISDEVFKEIAMEYVSYDREDISALANTVRNCHKSDEHFEKVINALLFGNASDNFNKRISFAQSNPEELSKRKSFK